jgi:hypothetical protein
VLTDLISIKRADRDLILAARSRVIGLFQTSSTGLACPYLGRTPRLEEGGGGGG